MRLTSLFPLAALVASAYAGCYAEKGVDAAWWDKADARGRAQDACRNEFKGTFGDKSSNRGHRKVCKAAKPPPANYGDRRQHYVFEIWHTSSGDRAITEAECLDGLGKEIHCDYGGESAYTNWRYK